MMVARVFSAFAMTWLVFFVSGFAALLYQVVWQRSLFAIFGINIESVTVVVTAFMLGLGLGSLVGGTSSREGRPAGAARLRRHRGRPSASSGCSRSGSFAWSARRRWPLRALVTALVTFLLVLVPTMLMGSTLPVLVAHLVRRWTNVGSSVGALYFVNTLGSALASFAAVLFLLGKLGQHGTVDVAAACNFTASALALREHFRADVRRPMKPARPSSSRWPSRRPAASSRSPTRSSGTGRSPSSRGASPAPSACLLGAYLTGIATGRAASPVVMCRAARRRTPSHGARARAALLLASFTLVANLVGFAVVPVAHAPVFSTTPWPCGASRWSAWRPRSSAPSFRSSATSASPPTTTRGVQLSYVYVANIVGSAAGSLLTGFVLLDHFSYATIALGLALAGVALAAALGVLGSAAPAGSRGAARAVVLGVCAAAAAIRHRRPSPDSLRPPLRAAPLPRATSPGRPSPRSSRTAAASSPSPTTAPSTAAAPTTDASTSRSRATRTSSCAPTASARSTRRRATCS